LYSYDKIKLQNGFVISPDFVKELGNITSFNQTEPAEGMGITGFNVTLSTRIIKINNTKNYWDNTAEGAGHPKSTFIAPQLTVTKGLPLNIDISANYLPIPGAGITAAGASVKWAFIEGSNIKPAAALRLGYSTLIKKTNFKSDNISFDVSISKGFAFITPYAYAGFLSSRVSDIELPNITGKTEASFHIGGGARITIGVFNIKGGIQLSKAPVYTLSGSIGF